MLHCQNLKVISGSAKVYNIQFPYNQDMPDGQDCKVLFVSIRGNVGLVILLYCTCKYCN